MYIMYVTLCIYKYIKMYLANEYSIILCILCVTLCIYYDT